ncbi:MAG TPA: glutamine-hydrolyzing GMP synthase [Terriglobales bacterium]|nr:glutamine-hydrolyzing GMP synthase [Terriglobales bacterium]
MPSIVILDFGGQYTQLIARRVRELHVFSAILPGDAPWSDVAALEPGGIILSGGPGSVYDEAAPRPDAALYSAGLPVLGICYGLQLLVHQLGGRVRNAPRREFGRAEARLDPASPLLRGLGEREAVWMSHGDEALSLPAGFRAAGWSGEIIAAIEDRERRFYGVQFHPEVRHTEHGRELLANFLFDVCRLEPNWTPRAFIEQQIEAIRRQVGPHGRALCALSGGVDSAVAATLVHRAIGDRLTCVFVNNGLLRKNEFERVQHVLRDRLGLHLLALDESRRFLEALRGVADPEQKRKIIGRLFIEVFEEQAAKLGSVEFLVQGTLYPDVIESVSVQGPSATIKSHHNVGGLPEKMRLKLVEPLRDLFKDEVRHVGRDLGLGDDLLLRQPFPGPGLAVRILGEITPERIRLLQDADDIAVEEIKRAGLYHALWQSFIVLLPVRTVGVMGDQRTYGQACALRAVESEDGMTADWARLPSDLLATISNRIVNEVPGINRVVFDITSKPPGTIEWE